MNIRKSLPKSDILWVTERTESENTYYITSDKSRTKYSLWKQEKDGVSLVTTGKTPSKFRGKMK